MLARLAGGTAAVAVAGPELLKRGRHFIRPKQVTVHYRREVECRMDFRREHPMGSRFVEKLRAVRSVRIQKP